MFKAAEYFFYSTLAVQITIWLSMNESFIFHIFIFKFLKRFVAGSINDVTRFKINVLMRQNFARKIIDFLSLQFVISFSAT